MPLHSCKVGLLPDGIKYLAKLFVLTDVVARKNCLILGWISQKIKGQPILLRVKSVTHKLWVIIWQINVMYVNDYAFGQAGHHFHKEHHRIGVWQDAVGVVNKEYIVFFELK